MTLVMTTRQDAAVIEQTLVTGDLAKLTAEQRLGYYKSLCDSLGLNPLTRPFEYITLNGKLVLYARKDCTEQLRSTRAVSVQIVARETVEDCYVVTARATMSTGRCDESIGAVSIGGLKGEARANAMMKAETKAKRRVTLSICGLGMLDETEVETIPHAALTSASQEEPQMVIDTTTGEMIEAASRPSAPHGYHYLADYVVRNEWHEVSALGWDMLGGHLRCSTKRPQIGSLLAQAHREGVPVKLDITMKKGSVGEAYVNSVTLWKQTEPVADVVDPLNADDIPF